MAVTLDGITLDGSLIWSDEHDWDPIAQIVTPTLAGAVIVEESLRNGAGRPITLKGGEDYGWLSYAQLSALRARRTPGREMTLALHDGRSLQVTWNYRDGPCLEAAPLPQFLTTAAYPPNALFNRVVIRLMQV